MFSKSRFENLEPWYETLKKAKNPVFVYGIGDGCLKALREFDKYGIHCKGIFASDGFARGNEFAGFKVRGLSDIEKEYGSFSIAAAFGTDIPEVMKRIRRLSEKYTLVFPDTPVAGETVFSKEVFLSRFGDAEKIAGLLADKQSLKVFENVLSFKITGNIDFLNECFTFPDEAYSNILRPSDVEVYADLGAYTGDTVAEFLEYAKGYRRIYAVEPNRKNFRKCVKNLIGLDNISLYNAAAWNRDEAVCFTPGSGRQARLSGEGVSVYARSLDSMLCGGGCTYVKYDVEGADAKAIEGSKRTILKYSPKICTAVYHRAYDILDIPILLNSIKSEYKLYLRQYPYYPAWETNLFAVM